MSQYKLRRNTNTELWVIKLHTNRTTSQYKEHHDNINRTMSQYKLRKNTNTELWVIKLRENTNKLRTEKHRTWVNIN